MSQSHHETTNKSEVVKMEINGHPYYVKSKGNVPYLYDIDTNDEVGYWSSKKGEYVMFTLYNRMMKQKYNNYISSDSDLKSNSDSDGEKWSETDSTSSGESSPASSPASSSNQSSSSCDDDNQEIEEIDSSSDDEETQDVLQKTSKKMNTYSIIFLFLILFTYLTLQKEFQSIYFDIIFLILINLLNTLKVFEILNDV